MFLDAELIWFIVSIKLVIGAVIGLIVVFAINRRQTTKGLLLRGVLLGAVGFLIASVIVGWAGSHEAFLNGRRVDVAPWGENLWLRNRIVEHEALVCILGSCLFAALVGLPARRKRTRPA